MGFNARKSIMAISRRKFLKTGCVGGTLSLLSTRMLVAQQYQGQRYQGQLIELGALDDGDTVGYVINDSNVVVGTSGRRGFFWSPESGIHDLGDLGGGITYGYNINSLNMIVGESTIQSGETRAFLYANGEMQDLGTLGGNYSTAEEVNDSGIVVGASRDANGVQHAYLKYPERELEIVPNLGGREAYAVSVNSTGQVCGFSETESGETHAFIYDAERGVHDIGTLGGGYCEGWQINDLGVACGISQTTSGETHGFVWVPSYDNDIQGTMIDIGGYDGRGTYTNFVSEEGVVLAMTEDEDIPLVANVERGDLLSVSLLTNPFYELSALDYARDGFQDEMRIQAPCAINSLGAITGWGVRDGVRRAYVLSPEPLGDARS